MTFLDHRRPVADHRPVILLEFNELCPDILAKGMTDGSLPNFKALHDRAQVFTTAADVDDPALLEPWIQWYSLHTGLAYSQHGVFHLTDGAKGGHEDIYASLRRAGRRVTSFCSMNVAPFAEPGSMFIADPWSDDGDTYPEDYAAFTGFVARSVREYSNDQGRPGMADALRFVAFMARHGLSAGTVATILRQLASEKLGDRRLSWRRVAVLDRLQVDLFLDSWDRSQPDFASLFLNSTAHLQHSYWRHHDPEPFTIKPSEEERAIYGDAIRFGYAGMDALVGRIRRFAARRGARVVLASALSQQPYLRKEARGGQRFYRLHDVEGFLRGLGIEASDVAPTMTHQFLARFDDAAARDHARATLGGLRLDDGRAIFGFADRGSNEDDGHTLYFGCEIASALDPDIGFAGQDGARCKFFADFYAIEAMKSGCHHPDGVLWIEHETPRVHLGRVSILDVFPTLHDLLAAPYATGERRGESLMPLMEGVKA